MERREVTKKSLIELLFPLDDMDEIVFTCEVPNDRGGETEEEFHSAHTWNREPGHITEIHLEKY